jgi:hypothetical protein
MPNRHWRILAALVGLALLGAAPAPDKDGNGKQPQSTAAIEQALNRLADAEAKQAETGEYETPCADGVYNNRSDLCAQWYAARAARDAAERAWWANFFSLLTITLTAAGTIAILITLRLTREANRVSLKEFARSRLEARKTAQDSERAIKFAEERAELARKQTALAEQEFRLRLRAYLVLEEITLAVQLDNGRFQSLHVGAKVSNAGQTPGHVFHGFTNLRIVPHGEPVPDDGGIYVVPLNRISVSVGREPQNFGYRDLDRRTIVRAGKGKVDIYLYSIIRYTDIFEDHHEIIRGTQLAVHLDVEAFEKNGGVWDPKMVNAFGTGTIPDFGWSN